MPGQHPHEQHAVEREAVDAEAEPEAREGVRGERPEHEADEDRGCHDDDAVRQVRAEVVLVEQPVVVVERDVLRPELDAGEDVDGLLERRVDHPPEREQGQDERDREGRVDENSGDAAPPRAHAVALRVPPDEPHRGHHQHQQAGEQHDQHRHRLPVLREQERGVVRVDRDQLRRRPRPAAGQDEDLVERPDRVDRPQRDGDEQDRHAGAAACGGRTSAAGWPRPPARPRSGPAAANGGRRGGSGRAAGSTPRCRARRGRGTRRCSARAGRVSPSPRWLKSGLTIADVRGVHQAPDDADDYRGNRHRQDERRRGSSSRTEARGRRAGPAAGRAGSRSGRRAPRTCAVVFIACQNTGSWKTST